jgi:hypothetical protein
MNFADGDKVMVNKSLFTDNLPHLFQVKIYPGFSFIELITPYPFALIDTSHTDEYYQITGLQKPNPLPIRIGHMYIPNDKVHEYLTKAPSVVSVVSGGRRRHRTTRKARRTRRRPSRRN